MFWGLIMEPNKRYTQTVEKSFHVSMASLDALHADGEIVQVMVYYDNLNYLMCSLQKGVEWQVPLDLNFQEGTKISFTCNGRGRVHLTGYLIPEDGMDMDGLDEEEDDEEDEDDEVPQLVGNQPKRKAQESPKDSKKIKRLKALMQEESSDDDDNDEDNLENEDDQDESLDIDGELEDDSEDDEDDEEDEDDSDEETVVRPEQKKPTKKEQQKQQQQQANKKQEKQKLVNGKDAKPEQAKQEKQEKKKGKGEQAQPQQQQQQQQKKAKGEQQNNVQQAQKKRVVDGGVQIEDVKVGTGANAKSGKFVSVYYIGRLTNGKKFDATTQGEGFKFRLGKGEVIKGWDVGIAGMKIGGKRRITIPPGMAYGAKGSPPVIPGNSTLVFEVELKNVH